MSRARAGVRTSEIRDVLIETYAANDAMNRLISTRARGDPSRPARKGTAGQSRRSSRVSTTTTLRGSEVQRLTLTALRRSIRTVAS